MSTATEHVNGTELPGTSHAESWARAGVVDAEAEAIRAKTAAEIEAKRIAAEAEAEAIKIKAREDAEKLRIANARQAMRLEKERADHEAKISEATRRKEAAERAAAEEREAAEAAAKEKAISAAAVTKSSKRWRRVAMGFYALCAGVALPVQIAAFYDEDAKYLVVAPIFIELIALVALVGAAAAATAGRPQWHYRAVAWAGALTAATINIVHGLDAFDAATAFGTALASIAGPGMWDLHEHGRIAKRDGKQTWRQKRAAAKAAKVAEEKAAAEKAEQAEKKAAAEAAETARQLQLAAQREELYPDVWEHAIKLAAALGETTVTEAIWRRAHIDIEGTEPGEDVDTIRTRNTAQRRLVAARSEAPGNKPEKITSSQRASQMPPSPKKRVYTPPARPGKRRAGDTPKYVGAARRAASETAKKTAASGS